MNWLIEPKVHGMPTSRSEWRYNVELMRMAIDTPDVIRGWGQKNGIKLWVLVRRVYFTNEADAALFLLWAPSS